MKELVFKTEEEKIEYKKKYYTRFFSLLSEQIGDGNEVNLTIKRKGDNLTVALWPKDKNNFHPFILNNDPVKLDWSFFKEFEEPLTFVDNLSEILKQNKDKEIELKTEKVKEEKSKTTKKIETPKKETVVKEENKEENKKETKAVQTSLFNDDKIDEGDELEEEETTHKSDNNTVSEVKKDKEETSGADEDSW